MRIIAFMLRPFRVSVTEKIYNRFVDKGEVSEEVLRFLAMKVIANKPMDQMEMAIFIEKTTEINELIMEIKTALNEE